MHNQTQHNAKTGEAKLRWLVTFTTPGGVTHQERVSAKDAAEAETVARALAQLSFDKYPNFDQSKLAVASVVALTCRACGRDFAERVSHWPCDAPNVACPHCNDCLVCGSNFEHEAIEQELGRRRRGHRDRSPRLHSRFQPVLAGVIRGVVVTPGAGRVTNSTVGFLNTLTIRGQQGRSRSAWDSLRPTFSRETTS